MIAILALDTSFNTTGAALYRDGRVEASAAVGKERGHSENLIELVTGVLRDAGFRKDDLTAIGVTVGPGSFTGLRVGVAFAKGLAVGLNLPMAPVSSLAALAQPHLKSGRIAAVAVDAKKGQLYGAAFDGEGRALIPQGAYMASNFAAKLAGLQLPVHLVGNGAEHHREELSAPLGGVLTVADPKDWEIDPCVVATMAAREIEEGRALAPGDLVPVYLRRSEAEEKFRPNP